MREKITGNLKKKYNGHQTIIFFGAAPSLQFRKNEDINYTPKKVCVVFEESDINGVPM